MVPYRNQNYNSILTYSRDKLVKHFEVPTVMVTYKLNLV